MSIGYFIRAAVETGREIAREAAKEGVKMVKVLDRPLNLAEVKETAIKEAKPESRLQELDRPLNCMDKEMEADKAMGFDENGFRPLYENEKGELRENTKWSDKAIDGCKVNEDGVIKYPCRNEDLAGKTNGLTDVEYKEQVVEAYNYQVEVVMPEFQSEFDVKLPEHLIEASDREQFKECNRQLSDAIKEDSGLAGKFTGEQLEQIEDGITRGGAPDGFTWHHDAETGKMQLVDSDLHGDTRHTGGRTIWGGGNDFR